MSTSTGLRISVADLLRRPGASRALRLDEPVADLGTPVARVPADQAVALDLTLERVSEGIVVRGTVGAGYEAECSRCLRPIAAHLEVHVDELYEPTPLPGETYLLDHDVIDLEPLVRDNVLPELPVAPLHDPGCRGLCPVCGADRNVTECDHRLDDTDDRWAALRSLDL